MLSFIQFRGPYYDFSRKTEIYLRNSPKLPNLWCNEKRGRGIGKNRTYGMIPTTRPDLKNDISLTLEIWGFKIALSTLCTVIHFVLHKMWNLKAKFSMESTPPPYFTFACLEIDCPISPANIAAGITLHIMCKIHAMNIKDPCQKLDEQYFRHLSITLTHRSFCFSFLT